MFMFLLLASLCGVASVWTLSIDVQTPQPMPFAARQHRVTWT